ncbi:MAG: LapA family protein [Pseudorhizobium sp.]
MTRLKKILNLVVLLPLGVLLVVLSVANRQSVTLALNPFRPQDSVLSLTAPFFLFLMLALILGMLIGALGTWWTQGRYRRQARVEAMEAVKWHNEADKQKTPPTSAVPVSLPPARPQMKTPALN